MGKKKPEGWVDPRQAAADDVFGEMSEDEILAMTSEQSREARLAVQKTASDLAPDKRTLTAEQNAAYIDHAMAALTQDRVNIYKDDDVERRTVAYIQSCKLSGTRPHPPGLANWLGITQAELYDWLTDRQTDDHRHTAARVYQMLHQAWADHALSGKVSPQIAIFLGKNWFGYTDVNRIEVQPSMQKAIDLEKLAQEAAALPDGDIIDAEYVEIEQGKKRKR